ncbi:Rieske (2Fe-2S) protein [Bradyrhizobium sp. ARR65]|uniref:Rieske (2Fe-2S) protein n=1 Tax=Bradyrhizobium sp. ARR65 TaxID=1040989 RepID=UPI00046300BA|nr:Rieske (2Fe-2S) protein [Bradyrhizobium sp. ARR65]
MYARPISVDDQWSGPSRGQRWIAAYGIRQLIEQTIVRARVEGADVILIWNDGRAVACERACPHEQADLSLGEVSMGRLFCPRHAASFDLRDGRICDGWPSRPLRLYPVRIADDKVWIDAEALTSSIA